MMYAKCDGCGKEGAAFFNGNNWYKPPNWFERVADNGEIQQACIRECVNKINSQRKKDGKETKPILPI